MDIVNTKFVGLGIIVKSTNNKIPTVLLLTIRKQKLMLVSINLKNKFVGIDDVIDKLILQIYTWYSIPELLLKPSIICLWGITGIGKTDLVRTLVKLLGMLNNYVLVQMGNTMLTLRLQWLILNSGISLDNASIILLDLIQRFRTLDLDGKLLRDNINGGDLWELLSDGKFSYNSKTKLNILWTIRSVVLHILLRNTLITVLNKKKNNTKKLQNKNNLDNWTIKSIKATLNNEYTINLLYNMLLNDILNKLWLMYLAQNFIENPAYSKLLIIISGNIDLAYSFSDWVSLADINPDIIWLKSKKVNIIDIKNALLNRFRPLQIARFGNNQIIYPSLNTESYNILIKKKLELLSKRIYEKINVKIIYDESIYDVIFRNGVYPTQGVRPVFSTISIIILSIVPIFLLKALLCNIKLLKLLYKSNIIYSIINNLYLQVSIQLSLLLIRIKKNKCLNKRRLVSVHLSGHAIVYSLLLKRVPLQITINTTNECVLGFVTLNSLILLSKNLLLDNIIISMAGRAALSIIFGNDIITSGAYSDIKYSTNIIGKMYRKFGMFDVLALSCVLGMSTDLTCIVDTKMFNEKILYVIQTSYNKAKLIILNNKKLFIKISLELYNNTEISQLTYLSICKLVNPQTDVIICNDPIIPLYNILWNKFIDEDK